MPGAMHSLSMTAENKLTPRKDSLYAKCYPILVLTVTSQPFVCVHDLHWSFTDSYLKPIFLLSTKHCQNALWSSYSPLFNFSIDSRRFNL